MDDFAIMMKDAKRLKKACRELADGVINNRMHAAFIMVDRAQNIDELDVAVQALRSIFHTLNKRELDYERDHRAVPDPAQSRREASVRHSPPARTRVGRGDLDSFNERAPSVPVLDSEHEGHSSGGTARDARRMARALPSPKRRIRKADLRPGDSVEGPDPDKEVPSTGLACPFCGYRDGGCV